MTLDRPMLLPSLPLSQDSYSRPCAPARGFSHPGPHAGPRDLIVLKHSSYSLILQCPISLVSDLHICWITVGCLLCSSYQLGVSLLLRGSGLCSHLSLRHLPDVFPLVESVCCDCSGHIHMDYQVLWRKRDGAAPLSRGEPLNGLF